MTQGSADGKYDIILADPPWAYHVRSRKGLSRSAENHYPTLQLDQIKAFDVGSLATDRAALFLWATSPCLPQAFELAEAWGWPIYSTVSFVWVKRLRRDYERRDAALRKILRNPARGADIVDSLIEDDLFLGLGHSTRANAEYVLSFWKGKKHLPRKHKGVRQIISAPIGEHSEKPVEAHYRIAQLYGDLPRAELFARTPRLGWDVWGNEVAADFVMPLRPGWRYGSHGEPVQDLS